MRAAIVLRQRLEHRAALIVALAIAGAAATQPLQTDRDLIEIGTHLLDLIVDGATLRILPGEQREEAGRLAAHPPGLLRDAVEFALLAVGRFLVPADLIGLGGITAAAIDIGQLRFEALAHRIGLRIRYRAAAGLLRWLLLECWTALRPRIEMAGSSEEHRGNRKRDRGNHSECVHHRPSAPFRKHYRFAEAGEFMNVSLA